MMHHARAAFKAASFGMTCQGDGAMSDVLGGCLKAFLEALIKALIWALVVWLFKVVLEGTYRSLPIIAALLLFVATLLFGTVIPYVGARANGIITLSPADVAALATVRNTEQLYNIAGSSIADAPGLEPLMRQNIGSRLTLSDPVFPGVLTINERRLAVALTGPVNRERTIYTGTFVPYAAGEQDAVARTLIVSPETLLPVYFIEYRPEHENDKKVAIGVTLVVGIFTLYTIWLFIQNTLMKNSPPEPEGMAV
jgi:hypothetical protein